MHFIYHNNVKSADEVKNFAQKNNLSINAYQADVRTKEQIVNVVQKIIDADERIDVLINNSGIVRDGLLMSLSDDDIKDVIDTNLIGMMQVIQEVVPHMMSKRCGKIINISSVSAEKGGRGQANYAASKGAVNAVNNRLIYSEDISVFTEASFLLPESYPFRMFFKIELEKAILEMDFWRPKGERLKVFPKDGQSYFPVLPKKDAYREEIDYFAKRLLDGKKFSDVPLEESILALKLCLASEESCLSNETVMID